MSQDLSEAKNKLRKGFSCNNSASTEKFEGTLSYLQDCPKGQEVIENLAELDYQISFDSLGFVKGMCTPDTRTILINDAFMTAMIAPTFVHESTHAFQLERMPVDVMQLNCADFIKASRAMEADANAHQAAFAYQARNKNTIAYRSEMESPSMVAYVEEMETSGNEKKAMQKAFMAWYDNGKAQRVYQENHTGTIGMHASMAQEDAGKFGFNQTISNEQLAKVFLFNGASYIEPSFFTSEKANAVPPADKEKIVKSISDLSEKTGKDSKKMLGNLKAYGETQNTAVLSKIKGRLAR